MKRALTLITITICLIAFIPALVFAEPDIAPPVGTPLVREGTFAVSLADALGLGAGEDEIAAESRLGELGISPRNGWIADYPVTPDIVGELQESLIAAADGARLPMGREEALDTFYDVTMELGLSVVPYADESIRDSSSEDYPAPATVNNYYYNYGPPVVTYYEPPPTYVSLYAWVPFPFWSWGFWFPGFYVLHDFHKTVVIDSRVVCVSNHYRDAGYKRVYVVDPVKRFHHSGTVYGVGAPRHGRVVYKGNPGVARQVLEINRNRMMRAHAGRNFTAPSGRSAPVVRPVSPSKERNRPAPVMRSMTAPVKIGKDIRNKKESVQPGPKVNSRTVQAGRNNTFHRDKKESQARPMLKSIENKPQSGKAPIRVEQKISRPPEIKTNAGKRPMPHAAVSRSAPSRADSPTRIQPQNRNVNGSGHGSGRAQQVRQDRGQGSAPGGSRGNQRRESAPGMRGSERGGRG